MKRNDFLKFALALAALGCGAASSPAQSASHWTVDSALAMMDRAAQDFRSLTADLENIKYTDVVKDTSRETGQIFVHRDEKMRIEIKQPDPRTILRLGGSLFIYTPKINRVEEYDLGKNRALVDQYILLGFGTKSESLKKSYGITFVGEEDLDNRKTIVFELLPKSDQIRRQIAKIRIWVDESSWLPIQQKFFEANSNDYFQFHYTNLRKNLKIDEVRFKQDWPKNVTREKPRG